MPYISPIKCLIDGSNAIVTLDTIVFRMDGSNFWIIENNGSSDLIVALGGFSVHDSVLRAFRTVDVLVSSGGGIKYLSGDGNPDTVMQQTTNGDRFSFSGGLLTDNWGNICITDFSAARTTQGHFGECKWKTI